MKQRFLLFMMTALLSVGAWATDDLTLNVEEIVHFGTYGFSKSGNTVTISDWDGGGGWVFDPALSKNDYYGVDFTFGAATTEDVKLIIVYNDATPTTQEIAVPSGSTNIHAVFNTNEDIKKIGFKMSVGGHDGSYSTNITITSAVVKAWGDDIPLNVATTTNFTNWGFSYSDNTITVSQYASGGWQFAHPIPKTLYSGIDLTFSETEQKLTLQITYANDSEYSYEIPAGSTHIAVGFDVDSNISEIGFKHVDNGNSDDVSITITSAVVLSSTTGTEVDVLGNTSFSVPNRYNYHAYKTFDSAINIDDYEKVVFTFSSVIPEDGLSLQAKIKDGDDKKTIGSLIKNGSKVTGYFSNMSSATIESIGFLYGWNSKQGTDDATTLSIASAKLYKKPTKSITIGSMTHGTVTASVTEAWEGKTVTLTAAPAAGYALVKPTVTDENSVSVAVTDNGDGTYSFTMPATAVTVNATFTSATALSTDRLIIYNKKNGSIASDEVNSNYKNLWVDNGEYPGWDLTVGRPVTTDEFAGIQVLYRRAMNINMQVTYGVDGVWTSDVITGEEGSSHILSVNFADKGITGVVKSIKFFRNSNADTMIQFESTDAVSLKTEEGASAPTPTSSLTLTYETLEDGGSGVTKVPENSEFTIDGEAGHWAGWIFTLPIPTTLYKGVNFNMTSVPANGAIEIVYEGVATPQTLKLTTGNNIVNFVHDGNITQIKFNVAGTYRMGTCSASNTYLAKITDAKYATYGAVNDAIDYTSASGLKAYIAKVEAGVVKLTEVSKVPANTAVVLYAETAGTYTLSTATGTTDNVSANQLQISDGTKTSDGTIYVLAKKDDVVGFYRLESGQKVLAGKAYLEVPSGSRSFIGFGDDTTGIDEAISKTEEVRSDYYDLQGRRVAQPTKGLYIVNGKKVIVK